jgi:hypothetical protein
VPDEPDSKITGGGNGMEEDALEQLRAHVRAPLTTDKVAEDKRLKAEILLMRCHVRIVEDKPGRLICAGSYGQADVDQKEATLFDIETQKLLRWQPYKSHLFAVHRALCWAVLGISIG